MPRGGKQPGAGRPKGSKDPHTLDKEDARRAAFEFVRERLVPILEALYKKGQGTAFMVYRDEYGKFIPITTRNIKSIKAKNYERLEVYDRPPDVSALQELLNRGLDKPSQPVDATVRGKLTLEELVSGALSPDEEATKKPAK